MPVKKGFLDTIPHWLQSDAAHLLTDIKGCGICPIPDQLPVLRLYGKKATPFYDSRLFLIVTIQ